MLQGIAHNAALKLKLRFFFKDPMEITDPVTQMLYFMQVRGALPPTPPRLATANRLPWPCCCVWPRRHDPVFARSARRWCATRACCRTWTRHSWRRCTCRPRRATTKRSAHERCSTRTRAAGDAREH